MMNNKSYLKDKDWLYVQYITMKKSTIQIGKELGCSYQVISRYLKKHDISIRNGAEAQRISKESLDNLKDKEWIYYQYIIMKKTPNQIGKEIGCSSPTVNKYIKKHDIPIRNGSDAHITSKELLDNLNNKEWLYYQYITLKKSGVQLSEELGCCHTTILNYLKQHDIPINYSYSRSYGENQVFEFVKQYCPDAIQSYRGIGKK